MNAFERTRAHQSSARFGVWVLLFVLIAAEGWAEPLSLHPRNPRYFLFRGAPTILMTSAEHYGAVVNLDFDYVRYLDALKAERMNHTRIFTGAYVEPAGAFNIASNTLAPGAGRFICPWPRSDTPGYARGGNKFDLSKWDDAYFRRLKDFMSRASERGIVVEVCLFCPFYEEMQWELSPMRASNNVNQLGTVARDDVHTLDKHGGLLGVHEAMTRKIVEELNEFDNLYFEVCNEPYFGGVTVAWQHHIAELIAATEKNMPHAHLISRNVANGSAQVTDPHPAISILNFHYASPPDAVALNAHLGKLIGCNETGFRGIHPEPYRREAWDFILAGGGLYNNLDYSYTAGKEDGTFELPPTQPGTGGPEFRRQLRLLKDFIESLDFIKLSPDTNFVRPGIAEGVSVRVLSEPGVAYAGFISPKPVVKDRFSVRWTGEIEPQYSETYTFYTLSNDGVRLWIDNKLLIDNWSNHSTKEDKAEVRFEADKRYGIKLEYYQDAGNAQVRLEWSCAGLPRGLVPRHRLFQGSGKEEGLVSEYFKGGDLLDRVFKRVDGPIDFDWSEASPFTNAASAPMQQIGVTLPAGSYTIRWLNSRSGATLKQEEFVHPGGDRALPCPPFAEEAAFKITAKITAAPRAKSPRRSRAPAPAPAPVP